MSLASAFAELNKSTAGESVAKGWLGSSRFLILVAFALVLYYARSLFTTELWIILASVTAVYMVCNTVTRVFEIREEGTLIRERQKLAWADGVLTEAEAAALNSADSMLNKTVAAPVVPTPVIVAPKP